MFFLLLFFFISAHAATQNFFRITADFSVKETLAGGKSRLVVGKVYYDINYKRLLYDITFPEKEKILVNDSMLVKIIPGTPIEMTSVASANEFSVFHLSLCSNLADFGLKNSPYKIASVEKDGSMVISTYAPPAKYASKLGKVILSQKDKRLFGLVMFNAENEVSGKQFFKNYSNINGLEFPCEITQITYSDGQEFYKITTFRNVVINEMQNENFYNYVFKE